MERTHKTRATPATSVAEQQVDKTDTGEREEETTLLLDEIDDLIDNIDDILEEAVVVEVRARQEVAAAAKEVEDSRAEQRQDDAWALAQLGLYAPLDLGMVLDPTCRLCGRCPVLIDCTEGGC